MIDITFKINESNNAISFFLDDSITPFVYQPTYPNGDLFESYLDAENWANTFILAFNDQSYPTPPLGHGLPAEQRVSESIENNIL